MAANIRIGTRGSRLAMWQANEVARKLHDAGTATEIVTITTTGDKRQDVSLATIGGKGVFIKELEEALQRGLLLLKAGVAGNAIRVLVPLVVTDQELDEALNAWEQALEAAL